MYPEQLLSKLQNNHQYLKLFSNQAWNISIMFQKRSIRFWFSLGYVPSKSENSVSDYIDQAQAISYTLPLFGEP